MSGYTKEDMQALLKKKEERLARLKRMKEERKKRQEARRRAMASTVAKTEDPTTGTDVLGVAPVTTSGGTENSNDGNAGASTPAKSVNLTAKASEVLKSISHIVSPAKKEKAELGFSSKITHNIQPAPRVICYDKGIQIKLETEKEAELKEELEKALKNSVGCGPDDQEGSVGFEGATKIKTEVKSIEDERAEEKAFQAQLLPLAERKRIMRTEHFLDFFRSSSKVVERALKQNEEFDVTIDYAKKDGMMDEKEEAMVSETSNFSYGMRTQNRPITSITWSPKHDSLFLVSYAAPHIEHLSMDPDGLVLVWSTHTPDRPEYVLTCQSAVLVAQFHPTKPEVIIAGTKSGQVIVWDMSVKITPVNRTSLSQGHTHPVYAMACVPAVNKAYSVLSVSTDGHVCIWQDIDHLEEPSTELDMQLVGKKADVKERDITTTCFGFVGRDSNSLVMGSDEGVLYKARIYDGNASRGIYSFISGAHKAPITNVGFRPPIKGLPPVMSELYITSSFDWTTKLWHTKTRKPLYVFERCRDYVYDVKWSPVHPAIFATGDGNGMLDIWNLNKDTELPTQSVMATEKDRSVGKLAFSNDGRKIAVGSSSGNVKLFTLNENLACPVKEDTDKFYESMRARLQVMAQLQSQQQENEKLRHYSSKSYSNMPANIHSLLNSDR
mmetsp:Transcript_15792/g.25753  ORF Transcript_15792/g.25753 Transcript_15792/m.25753 type:complete len:667 (-) Transcript_15792:153-2153(-)